MKHPAKKLILALLGLTAALSLSAQTTIKGVVTDEGGEPLMGAGVFVEGTTIGVVTGLDGDYELTVPADAKNLVFSFIGLADQTVAINGQTTIDVVLKEDSTFLDEVVVVGYQTVKRRDLLGSVSMVSFARGVFGDGGCGKGHKEWVKVSDGGPYLKTVGRLG